MSHPLEQKLSALRGRLRRMVMCYALSWAIGAVLATVILLGLADYVIRFQDPGLRVICWLALLGVVGWVGYRRLYLPSMVRLRDADLAGRIERHFSGLQDRLRSSVEFLAHAEDDPLAGSAALRRAVIAQTTAETEPLNFADVLDARPPRRAAMTAAAIVLVAAILAVLDPSAARLAVARLMNPFGNASWPQQTRLLVRNPVSYVARGQTFELEVAAAENTKLPAEVHIHYRLEGNSEGDSPIFVERKLGQSPTSEQVEPMRRLGALMVARRENVIRPFSYRVEGGDDQSLPWTAVEVLTPPAVRSLSLRLIPPAYTGWPAEKSDKHIHALVGTRVEITAESNKPLASAALCLEGDRQVRGGISGDGRHFVVPAPGDAPLLVDKSGSYWFALKDREGLDGGSEPRWEIRAMPDLPPSVAMEEPTANLFVTSRAVVPLRIAAKDDLAIREIALAFGRSDRAEQPETIVPLYTAPEQVQPSAGTGLSATDAGDRQVVRHRWELERLELSPGTEVTFYATARDYLPQTAPSELRRLVVITPEELQQRLAGRQSLVLAELDRVLKMQRACRGQVQSLEIRLAETGRLEQIDADRLQAAELNQRQVNRSLTDRGEGVPMHVLAVLADLANNKVDNPDVQRRMEALLVEIDRLERQNLVVIGRELTAAIKAAQVRLQETPSAASDATMTAPLAAAGKSQDEVIAALERMLGQLAQWDHYRRFYRDVAQLLHDQEEAMRQTEEVGRHTLTKAVEDLTPQEHADLKALAAGQLERGRRFDRILQEMEQARADLRQNDPLAAETVGDALTEARRLGISGQMQSGGAQLAANQIGQAVARQKQVAQDLRDVLDILANRRQYELARLVKQLRQAEAELEKIQRQQAALQLSTHQQAGSADDPRRKAELQRLAVDEERLQQEVQRLMRQLDRLEAQQAARTMQQAAGEMGQAVQHAGQGNQPGADQQSEAAVKTLAEARRQLAARRLQAQAALAADQMARLEDDLKHLHGRQKNVLAETVRLEDFRRAAAQRTRAQAASVADLARLQHTLGAETVALGDGLSGAGAFPVALAAAADKMREAAALLAQRQTGDTTQESQQLALARLQLLLEALKPDTPASQPSPGGSGQGGTGQAEKPASGVPTLAELKLLKLLQQEINLRTAQLPPAVEVTEKLTDPQRHEYNRLGEEQGGLAALVWQPLQADPENPEDPGDGNPLASIAGRMREVGNRIGHNDAGPATQAMQQGIVADLDRLVQQARQACQQGQPGQSSPQQASTRTPAGPPPSQPKGGGQKPSEKPTASSTGRQGTGKPTQSDLTQMLEAIDKKVWGSLPPREREQLLQLRSEEFLPQYQALIEEYYRRLSEGEKQ